MEEVNKILNNFYTENDEDSRLIRDKVHNIEFITTTNYVEKYINKGDKILEIGAGSGRYSIYFAKKGYEVKSLELLQVNIEKFKKNITQDMNIEVIQGTATDLSTYPDNYFDITLCLGPLYHLFKNEDKNKAISEAIRVTKKGGKIFFAYITNESMIFSNALKYGKISKLPELCDNNFKFNDNIEEVFSSFYVQEFNEMMSKYNVKFLKNVATDGIANEVSELINNLSEEEYEIWLKYHLSICERTDLMGYSDHILYICEKQ